MPNLSRIAKCCQRVTVGDGPDALHVDYNPSALTPRREREMRSLRADNPEGRDILCATLAGMLVGWDLTDDEGLAIGVDEESLTDLPFHLLGEISRAIMGDLLPNETTTAPSGSFS